MEGVAVKEQNNQDQSLRGEINIALVTIYSTTAEAAIHHLLRPKTCVQGQVIYYSLAGAKKKSTDI